MPMKKRKVDVLAISDLHLGSIGCKARALSLYLHSIEPSTVVLNGDIVNLDQFGSRDLPDTHIAVMHQLIGLADRIPVYYVTGDEDREISKWLGIDWGNIQIVPQLSVNIAGRRTGFIHGDVLEQAMRCPNWLRPLYNALHSSVSKERRTAALLGRFRTNAQRTFVEYLKANPKKASKSLEAYKAEAIRFAIAEELDTIVTGHTHHPADWPIAGDGSGIVYLNTGDWMEHLTALEWNEGTCALYTYDEEEFAIHELMANWAESRQKMTA